MLSWQISDWNHSNNLSSNYYLSVMIGLTGAARSSIVDDETLINIIELAICIKAHHHATTAYFHWRIREVFGMNPNDKENAIFVNICYMQRRFTSTSDSKIFSKFWRDQVPSWLWFCLILQFIKSLLFFWKALSSLHSHLCSSIIRRSMNSSIVITRGRARWAWVIFGLNAENDRFIKAEEV